MEYINIGKIVNTHGLKGEVRVLSDSHFKEERFKKGSQLYIENEKVIVSSHRKHKKFDLLVFEKLNDINLVEKYKGKTIFVDKEDLLDLAEDDYYFHQLEGLAVYVGEEKIGEVEEMLEITGNVLMVIKMKDKKVKVPFVDEFIKDVDLETGKIIIDPIEGLL